MQGLAGLDISQTPVTSTPVGGARPKVHVGLEKVTCDVKAESEQGTPDQNQSGGSTQPQVRAQVTDPPLSSKHDCNKNLNPSQTDPASESPVGKGAEPEPEGACGWTKSLMSLELTCGGQTDVRETFIHNDLILTCLSL